jgi:hypothetical protein
LVRGVCRGARACARLVLSRRTAVADGVGGYIFDGFHSGVLAWALMDGIREHLRTAPRASAAQLLAAADRVLEQPDAPGGVRHGWLGWGRCHGLGTKPRPFFSLVGGWGGLELGCRRCDAVCVCV